MRRASPSAGAFELTTRVRQSNEFDGLVEVSVNGEKIFSIENVRTAYRSCTYDSWCTDQHWSVNRLLRRPQSLAGGDLRRRRRHRAHGRTARATTLTHTGADGCPASPYRTSTTRYIPCWAWFSKKQISAHLPAFGKRTWLTVSAPRLMSAWGSPALPKSRSCASLR